MFAKSVVESEETDAMSVVVVVVVGQSTALCACFLCVPIFTPIQFFPFEF